MVNSIIPVGQQLSQMIFILKTKTDVKSNCKKVHRVLVWQRFMAILSLDVEASQQS